MVAGLFGFGQNQQHQQPKDDSFPATLPDFSPVSSTPPAFSSSPVTDKFSVSALDTHSILIHKSTSNNNSSNNDSASFYQGIYPETRQFLTSFDNESTTLPASSPRIVEAWTSSTPDMGDMTDLEMEILNDTKGIVAVGVHNTAVVNVHETFTITPTSSIYQDDLPTSPQQQHEIDGRTLLDPTLVPPRNPNLEHNISTTDLSSRNSSRNSTSSAKFEMILLPEDHRRQKKKSMRPPTLELTFSHEPLLLLKELGLTSQASLQSAIAEEPSQDDNHQITEQANKELRLSVPKPISLIDPFLSILPLLQEGPTSATPTMHTPSSPSSTPVIPQVHSQDTSELTLQNEPQLLLPPQPLESPIDLQSNAPRRVSSTPPDLDAPPAIPTVPKLRSSSSSSSPSLRLAAAAKKLGGFTSHRNKHKLRKEQQLKSMLLQVGKDEPSAQDPPATDAADRTQFVVVMGEAVAAENETGLSSIQKRESTDFRISSRRRGGDGSFKTSVSSSSPFTSPMFVRDETTDPSPALLKKAIVLPNSHLGDNSTSSKDDSGLTVGGVPGFVFESGLDTPVDRKDGLAQLIRQQSLRAGAVARAGSRRGSVSSTASTTSNMSTAPGIDFSESPASDYGNFFHEHDKSPATITSPGSGGLLDLVLDSPEIEFHSDYERFLANAAQQNQQLSPAPAPALRDKNPFLNMLLKDNNPSEASLETLGNRSMCTLTVQQQHLQRPLSSAEYDYELDLLSMYLAD